MAEGGAGWAKRVIFSLIPCLVLLGGAELVLRLAGDGGQPASVPLVNLHDRDGARLELDPAIARRLPDSVLYNIRSNALTRPDPELLFRVRSNPSGAPVHGYGGINGHGFRGRDPTLPRPPGALVVMLLGDSCAFGWGIHDQELTIANRLEQALEQSLGPTLVYNLAQPGYSSAQVRRLERQWAPSIEPDVVVLYLGWNDLWSANGLSDSEALRALAWTRLAPLRWIRSTRVYAALSSLRERSEADASFASGPERRRVSPEESVANLRAMLDESRRLGARVILIPPPFAMGGQKPLAPMTGYVQLLAHSFEGEISFLSLPEMAAGRRGAERYFLEDRYHPNDDGARYIAQELARLIVEGR